MRKIIFLTFILLLTVAGIGKWVSGQKPVPVSAQTTDDDWYTVGANSQRTSWVKQEVTGSFRPAWYRVIEAYIPQNVQIITYQGNIYVSTARGLYVFNADTGDTVCRYDTELPLGNSPTVVGGVAYVGGYDRKIHALDATTCQEKSGWPFKGASAGYSANPIVVSDTYTHNTTMVFAASRDGYIYGIEASTGTLKWQYPAANQVPLGSIQQTPAYKNGVVYFAADDNFGYAVNVSDTVGSLKWKSAGKIPGDGFKSYWAVVYNSATFENPGKDYVVFTGAAPYRNGKDPGTGSIKVSSGSTTGYSTYDGVQRDDIFAGGGSQIGTNVSDSGSWKHSKQAVNISSISEYLEDNPATDAHKHKPWRKLYTVFDAATGMEYTTDVDGDGYREYAPITYW